MISYDRFVVAHHRWLHALRMMLTCTIAVIINSVGHVPFGMWSLITIIVVMSATYVGAIVAKGTQRIGGTIIGALLGLSLYFMPWHAPWLHNTLYLIFIGIAMYFTIGKYSYGAVLIGITLTLVAASGPGDLSVALWRTVNVIWGAILSMICSRYLFPARAQKHFQLLCSDFLETFTRIYQTHNSQLRDQTPYEALSVDELQGIMAKISGLQANVIKESTGMSVQVKRVVACQRRLLNILEALTQTPWRHQYGHDKLCQLAGLCDAKQEVAMLSQRLSEQINQGDGFVIFSDKLQILTLLPAHQKENSDQDDVNSDISYYSYLWLNRELARQLCSLSVGASQYLEGMASARKKKETSAVQ